MADNDNPQKADLQEVKRLANRYAQSRVLPLIIPLVLIPVMLAGTNLIPDFVGAVLTAVEEPPWATTPMLWAAALLPVMWAVLCVWLMFKGIKRYGPSFYRGEGQAVLRSEGIPIWAWALYAVTFVAPALLSEWGSMPIRWALPTALTSLGVFVLYAAKRGRETPLGIVFGGLLLVAAIATAAGLPSLFHGDWDYAYYWTLIAYVMVAGLVTLIVVHLYNRRTLRRLKGANPLGSRQ